MVDLKQLKYFIVCMEVGSFSKAAKILYTTQSNVSKAIKALEQSVGASLFIREAHGISPTPKGRHVYQYACKIMDDVGAMQDFSETGDQEWLNVSCNSSSWFANRFVEFYNLHERDSLHCQIYTTSVNNVMKRVKDYKDDIGFIYIMGVENDSFQYELTRSGLEFVALARVEPMLYLGEKHPHCHANQLEGKELEKLRFIQSYRDNFVEQSSWKIKDSTKDSVFDMDVAVITNSDYIMEKMLQSSRLANVSGSYLSNEKNEIFKSGIPLEEKNGELIFGYLKRKGEKLKNITEEFKQFICTELNK